MRTLSVSLPAPLEAFVREKVSSGGYSSASEVICEGLRLLQQYDTERLRTLSAAIRKGVAQAERGEFVPSDEVTTRAIAARGNRRLASQKRRI